MSWFKHSKISWHRKCYFILPVHVLRITLHLWRMHSSTWLHISVEFLPCDGQNPRLSGTLSLPSYFSKASRFIVHSKCKKTSVVWDDSDFCLVCYQIINCVSPRMAEECQSLWEMIYFHCFRKLS